jgi:thiol-disulfide isomerase/thioredoxin
MRKVIAALLVVAVSAAGGFAQEKKDAKAKLAVGDAAPPLTKVTAWLNGPEPKTFEKDKVYVLEFWATWCTPCIAAMPHLTELAKENAAKGLVVIGLTNKDPNGNTKESVTAFVEKNKGTKLGYPVAYSDGEENYAAYMDAADQRGIPCSFVVGKTGRVEYIGHPNNLDEVLPKVLDGTWKGKADADLLEARENDFLEVLTAARKKPEDGLEKFAAFAKKYPEKAKQDDVRGLQLQLLLAVKKFDDAKPIAEELIAAADKKKKAELAGPAIGFAIAEINPDKKHFDLGVKALETALKLDEKNLDLLLAAVQVYTGAGDKAKADVYGKKAIEAAPNADVRKQVVQVVEQIMKGGK